MNLKKAWLESTMKLKKAGITSADLDAEVLLFFVLNKPKEYLYTYPEAEMTKIQTTKYKQLIQQRIKNCPLAYLTGKKEFYGLEFEVNKNVLVPRPETEILVEKAIQIANGKIQIANKIQTTNSKWQIKSKLQKTKYKLQNSRYKEKTSYKKQNTKYKIQDIKKRQTTKNKIRIVEIGTGSGCIAVSLAKEGYSLTATDISAKALSVAKRNARKHGVLARIKFIKGDLLEPVKNKKIDLIMANLPYLPLRYKKERVTSEEKALNFEPAGALYSGIDGLDDYKRLFEQVHKLTNQPKNILIEIDNRQTSALKSLIKKVLPSYGISFLKDLAGRIRFAIVSRLNYN